MTDQKQDAEWTQQQDESFNKWLMKVAYHRFIKWQLWAKFNGQDPSFKFWREMQKKRVIKTGSI